MSRRRRQHEEHVNHEAWAIPYGDLLTLLLAFFVVLYAISSVNEGKYRVMSESLSEAFGGPPQSNRPVQFGERRAGDSDLADFKPIDLLRADHSVAKGEDGGVPGESIEETPAQIAQLAMVGDYPNAVERMTADIRRALGGLIDRGLVSVNQTPDSVEVELRTDILFPSGSANVVSAAREPLSAVASVLANYPNPLRIEGHTDNQPISTAVFPSNWELSAARAASVVHQFAKLGVDPQRMSVAGFGEYRPVAGNDSDDGRNRNRRVVVVIGAMPDASAPLPSQTTVAGAAAGDVSRRNLTP